MIRRPPRSTHCISSAASDVYKRQFLIQTIVLCKYRKYKTIYHIPIQKKYIYIDIDKYYLKHFSNFIKQIIELNLDTHNHIANFGILAHFVNTSKTNLNHSYYDCLSTQYKHDYRKQELPYSSIPNSSQNMHQTLLLFYLLPYDNGKKQFWEYFQLFLSQGRCVWIESEVNPYSNNYKTSRRN
eukprot:TRINITY_DN1008_c0_g1_i3.p1 TRINITY_DN1008_c0_g1~~TRINITY_DN1008_c0_g1_i3.p1  ORF type:complete len:183 (-),score=20.06 TRINITY_DN1008_c0_g1_i3:182-730(-)